MHRIPSNYRTGNLCIRIWRCSTCLYFIQRRNRKTTSVYWLAHRPHPHAFDGRLVSYNPEILIYNPYSDPRSRNIQTVIIARFLAGGFGSTGAIMVGGTIADIWKPHQFVRPIHTTFSPSFFFRRSLPMSVYSLAAVGGTGLGPVAAGWVEMNHRLQWRWIQWIHMMFVILFTAINVYVDASSV